MYTTVPVVHCTIITMYYSELNHDRHSICNVQHVNCTTICTVYNSCPRILASSCIARYGTLHAYIVLPERSKQLGKMYKFVNIFDWVRQRGTKFDLIKFKNKAKKRGGGGGRKRGRET